MGERFNLWWTHIENTLIPQGSIIFKLSLSLLLTWFILGTDSPGYIGPGSKLLTFGLMLMTLTVIYPELKIMYLYYKGIFTKEN